MEFKNSRPFSQAILALFLFFSFPLILLYYALLVIARPIIQKSAGFFLKDSKVPPKFVQSVSAILAQEDIHVKPKLNLVLFLQFDGPIEIERLRHVITERVIQKRKQSGGRIRNELEYPELQQYWSSFMNFLFWIQDDKFDIKNHVREYDYGEENCGKFETSLDLKIPRQGCNEEDVRRVVGSLLSKPWKKYQSPWEILLVSNFKPKENSLAPNLKSNQGSLLIFRLHHALADGYSILKLLGAMMEVEPKIQINFPKPMSLKEKIFFGLLLPFKLPWDLASVVLNSFDGPNCWHKRSEKLSREYYTSISEPIGTDLVKRIKNNYGVSYLSVICACLAGSCARIMKEAGQEVPGNITCATPTPIPNHPGGLVNHLSALFVKWPLKESEFKTRKSRLFSIHEEMAGFQTSLAPLGLRFFTKLATLSPNFICRMGGKLQCTTILSSFPGPQEMTQFLGVTLNDIFVGVGCGEGSVGATMMVVSYNGRQRFVTNIDKSLFPAYIFHKLDSYMEQELLALELESQPNQANDFNPDCDENNNTFRCSNLNAEGKEKTN